MPTIFEKGKKKLVSAGVGQIMAYVMADPLMNKKELAKRLSLQVRGVESLMRQRKIPFLRVSHRLVRFSWPKVEAALAGYEVRPIIAKGKGG